MADDLEERLRSHADAFDGLLSLIPAKFYYGEDTTDQWQRKKQTKEQARNAKRAKLDPDSQKTAKDVMDEKARKRKRDGEGENGDSDGSASDSDGELNPGHEMPREGLNRGQKKQKRDEAGKTEEDKQLDEKKAARAERKAAKKEARKKKLAEKLEKKKLAEQQKKHKETTAQPEKQPKKDTTKNEKEILKSETPATETQDVEMEDTGDVEIEKIEGFSMKEETDATSAPDKSASNAKPQQQQQENRTQPPKSKQSQEELKQRLQKRLEELRAARHADGLNGKPARNRQELIEARRQREEARRAHKKELRQKAKEEEQRKNDEAISRRFSPRGGSLLASPGSPADSITSISNNFSFGRVMFADGQTADPTLTALREEKKKRGPQDAKTALLAAEAKKQRLAALDPEKRKEIEEKDRWLNAKKRAHGEKVKDDVSLLKKTVHRHEILKKKSEKEWKERMEGIAKGKEMKQQKREENLKKRREEKGHKGKKAGKAGKGRAGFEGKGGKR
ncbi:hypothetical protein KEM56_002206 [Ascosphaera pollenicola]|nr:hypothetical protein KEM56_002206 [Ascosphaera pollenicola]